MKSILFLVLSCLALSAVAQDKTVYFCKGKNIKVTGEFYGPRDNETQPREGGAKLSVTYYDFLIYDSVATMSIDDGIVTYQTPRDRNKLTGMGFDVDEKTLKGEFAAIDINGGTIQRKLTCTRWN